MNNANERGIPRAMNTPNQPANTNNYFIVPGFRIVPSAETADVASDVDALKRKAERIAARPPLPVDWARYFFFDDTDPSSTLRAFEGARRVSAGIAAFRTPTCPGPWASVKVIGEFEEEVN